MDLPTATPERVLFVATVKPHRSLDKRGMVIVIGAMLTGSLLVTSLMALIGAWPVIGFNGADISLAVFLMWLNVRAARAVEILTLSESHFIIERTDIHGKTAKVTLAPYWLNVVLEERPGTVPRLTLSARGTSQEVGHQLGETQKRDLAAALTRVLHNWRNPVYDNPQLRT